MRRIAWLLVPAVLSPGCSFLMSRPPTPHTVAHASCPGVGAPAVDSYVAASAGATAVLGLGLASEDDSEIDDGGFRAIGAIGLGLAALYGASASHGFRQARACRALKAAFLASSSSTWSPPTGVWVAPSLPPPVPAPVVIEHEEETETVETRTTTRSRTIVIEP